MKGDKFSVQQDHMFIRAVLLTVGASLSFNLMNAVIQSLQDLHAFEIAFFRNVFGLLALAPFFLKSGIAPLKTKRLPLHLLRAGINVISMLCFFYAIQITPLAEVASLGFTLPLFVTVYAAILLREKLRARRLVALGIGVIGAAIIVQPWSGQMNIGAYLLLAGSAIWGLALMVIRLLGRTDSAVTITAWASILLAVLSLPPALLVWRWPTPEEYALLALTGVFGTLGALGVSQALRLAEANALMPYDFIKLIWAALIGYLVFGQVPALSTWIGGAIVFGATAYLTYREAQLKRAGTLKQDVPKITET